MGKPKKRNSPRVANQVICPTFNCQAVADKGGEPFLHFKTNATAKAKGLSSMANIIRGIFGQSRRMDRRVSHEKHGRGSVPQPQKMFWSL